MECKGEGEGRGDGRGNKPLLLNAFSGVAIGAGIALSLIWMDNTAQDIICNFLKISSEARL